MPSGVRRPPAVLSILFVVLGTVWPAFGQPFYVDDTDHLFHVLIEDSLFAGIVYNDDSEFGEVPRPFIYPIYGPTGATMTRHYPMRDDVAREAHDHPHHRSLWFAHGDVNGVDFWAEGDGKGRILEMRTDDTFLGGGGIAAAAQLRTAWIAPDGEELLDVYQLAQFSLLDDGSRVIDVALNMVTGEAAESVTFGDTKEGTMAIRTHPALRLVGEHATGSAVNSEGDTDRDLWGKRAKWVAYWGTIDGAVCGVAIFDHPENLRHPTWWHARDYGLIAANPFGIHDFENAEPGSGDYTLEWGETLTLRYRFVFFAGDAEQADIAGKYAAWVAETMEEESAEE